MLTLIYSNLEIKDFKIEDNVMGSPQLYNATNAILQLDNFILNLVPLGEDEAAIESTSLTLDSSVHIKNNVADGVVGLFARINPDNSWRLLTEYLNDIDLMTVEDNTMIENGNGWCSLRYFNIDAQNYTDFTLVESDCTATY